MKLELTQDEALVFFEWLSRLDEQDAFPCENPAEQQVLWSLHATEGSNGFIALEHQAFGDARYALSFTPDTGQAPSVGAVPFSEFSLTSGNYPLEALAEAWAWKVYDLGKPGGDPALLWQE